MRYADDASRVFSFLRQLVVASDVVFFFSLIFFGLGPCLVSFGWNTKG